LVQRVAKRLLRKSGLPPTELDELQQQLTVELWQSSRSFDPARGSWHAFAKAAVSHAAGKIVRHRRAEKRDSERCVSLNVDIIGPSGQSVEFAQTVTETDASRHLSIEPLPFVIRADLSMDVNQVTSTLSGEQQFLLTMVATVGTPEAVDATGIKRSTLNDRLKKARERLGESGLKNYFEI
jgi:RNA polymerase sigma factor (sigma-70 family)